MDPKTRLATGYVTTLLTNEIHVLPSDKPYGFREKLLDIYLVMNPVHR